MLDSLNNELPGHKYYMSDDSLLEWQEPEIVRKQLTTLELKKLWKRFPTLLVIYSMFGLTLIGLRVWSKKHDLVLGDLHLPVLLPGALCLGSIFYLSILSQILVQRWTKVTVRLASKGVGKFGASGELHCEYDQIDSAKLSSHPLVHEVRAILLKLRNGKQSLLGIPDNLDPTKVFQILKEHGVNCECPEENINFRT